MDRWNRLSPLSPVVRLSGVPVLAALYGFNGLGGRHEGRGSPVPELLIPLAIVLLTSIGGVISWLVTRWRIDGSDLQIEMGLLRRQSLRIPLARIQAVDVVSPLLARFLGLAEVRVVSAGGGSERSRLAYLKADKAQEVRSQLLALAHGLAPTATAEVSYPLFAMDNGMFVMGTLLRAPIFPLVGCGVLFFALSFASPRLAAGTAITLASAAPALIGVVFALLNADWGFTLGEAQDGFRLDRGLLQTRHETIPLGRVQGVRVVQPLLWKPLGWYAIGVDVARQSVARRTDREAQSVSRWLAPIANAEQMRWLVSRVCPDVHLQPPAAASPPSRAKWVMPLMYRLAACWTDARYTYARDGRLRSRTVILPHEKVQSIRIERGPLRRMFGLSDLYVDTAGRRWTASAWSRDANEANEVAWKLAGASRRARAS